MFRKLVFALLIIALLIPSVAALAGDNFCTDVQVQFVGDPGFDNTNVVVVSGNCHGEGRYRVSLWIDYPGQEVPYDPSFLEGPYFESRSGYDPGGPYHLKAWDTRGVVLYDICIAVDDAYHSTVVPCPAA